MDRMNYRTAKWVLSPAYCSHCWWYHLSLLWIACEPRTKFTKIFADDHIEISSCSGIPTSLTAVALPEAITECLARHQRELQRDLSDSIQVFFWIQRSTKPVPVGWILVWGNWIAECDLQARHTLGIFIQFPVCEDFQCFSSVASCGSTVSGLACSADPAHSFHADHRLWGGTSQTHPRPLRRKAWVLEVWNLSNCTFLLSFLWHLPLQNGLEVTKKQFKKKHFMGIGIIRYVGVCGLWFAYKVFWIHFLFGAYTTSMEISWTSKLHLTGEVATRSETMEIHRVSCLLMMISWSWCWCLRKSSVNEWNLLIYLYLEWMAGHVSRIY